MIDFLVKFKTGNNNIDHMVVSVYDLPIELLDEYCTGYIADFLEIDESNIEIIDINSVFNDDDIENIIEVCFDA